jgi:hypothetical protein
MHCKLLRGNNRVHCLRLGLLGFAGDVMQKLATSATHDCLSKNPRYRPQLPVMSDGLTEDTVVCLAVTCIHVIGPTFID